MDNSEKYPCENASGIISRCADCNGCKMFFNSQFRSEQGTLWANISRLERELHELRTSIEGRAMGAEVDALEKRLAKLESEQTKTSADIDDSQVRLDALEKAVWPADEESSDAEADLIAEWLNAPDGARVVLSGIGTAYRIADQINAREHRAWDKRRKEVK